MTGMASWRSRAGDPTPVAPNQVPLHTEFGSVTCGGRIPTADRFNHRLNELLDLLWRATDEADRVHDRP
jgi:hypothetical protein